MTNKKSAALRQNVGNEASTQNVAEQKLYCYLRVSTQGQVEKGHSIDNQKATGKRIAKQMGLTYVEMNEGGLSSMSLVRPVYEEILQRIVNGEIKNIRYFSRSRWTRDIIGDLITKRDYLVKYSVNVYEGETGELRKMDDPMDELVDNIKTSIQQQERRNIRMRSVSGKRHLSASLGHTGVFMGGTPAFGYKNIDKKWTIAKDESEYVKQIFNLYVDGKSIQDIKLFLDKEGVKPRRAKLWNIHTILKMLGNKSYVGEHEWFDKENEKRYPIVVPQIISRSVFNRTKKMIEKNTKNKGNNSRQYESLLSNFLVCSCGEKILGHTRKTVNKRVYVCCSKVYRWKGKDVAECNNRRGMQMDATDTFVLGCIRDVFTNSHILKDKFKKDVLSQKNIDSHQIEIEKDMREKHIKSMDYAIDKLNTNLSKIEVDMLMQRVEQDIYDKIKTILTAEKEVIQNKKINIIGEIDDLDSRKEWLNWITKFGDDVNKKFDNPSVELLEGMVSKIYVEPTYDKNRDGLPKQVGHKLEVLFKQPIVDDKFEYINPENKSDGYNIKNGKKKLNVGTIAVVNRGVKKKPLE